MTRPAVIAISPNGFTPYGAAEKFMYCKAPEVIIEGPYDTGKTITALQKLNILMAKYTGARGLMVRKTYQSLVNSAVVTWEKRVHRNQFEEDANYPVRKYGGQWPVWYDYPNGARITLGGMDKPDKTLSAEYDIIYVNQAEELTEDEWQALTRAASGRAGNIPYSQVIGDCNPDVPGHWILERKRLTRFQSRHEDNPTIFDQETGECIAPGRIAALDAMTGVRYKRGRLGLWVGREGQVYEFDPAVHMLNRDQVPAFVRWYRAVDFGYTNPFVCQWWGEDGDGRLYRYREIYMSGRTVNEHAGKINELSEGEFIYATICDHDAEDRATLHQHGIPTIAAKKDVSTGIQAVEDRLKIQGDGKPRLFLVRDALVETDPRLFDPDTGRKMKPTCTEEEFPGYVWPETKAQRAADERPVKAEDHGMDAMRYMVMYADKKRVLEAW